VAQAQSKGPKISYYEAVVRIQLGAEIVAGFEVSFIIQAKARNAGIGNYLAGNPVEGLSHLMYLVFLPIPVFARVIKREEPYHPHQVVVGFDFFIRPRFVSFRKPPIIIVTKAGLMDGICSEDSTIINKGETGVVEKVPGRVFCHKPESFFGVFYGYAARKIKGLDRMLRPFLSDKSIPSGNHSIRREKSFFTKNTEGQGFGCHLAAGFSRLIDIVFSRQIPISLTLFMIIFIKAHDESFNSFLFL
jgi:hypothetical protein